MKRRARSHCPISFALDTFGDHWSLLVLRDLIFKGKSRYQEFLASDERISTNILADRLSRLENAGIITRKNDPINKKQILYAPTKKGLDLIPVMLELVRWSIKYDSETATPKKFIRELEKDFDGLADKILSQFKR
ncbi:helix-turn-helix transcriptional regulator [bacterium]|nr:helix-turn-helix transcriptional regulator [bacterium]